MCRYDCNRRDHLCGIFPFYKLLKSGASWRIQILCGKGRIPGAMRVGAFWVIPEDAPKPADARIKSGKYIKKPEEDKK